MLTYPLRALTGAKAIALCACSLLLTGCSSFYLHNAEDAKAMLAGTEGLAKARQAQTAFFESQQKTLEEAFKAERAAIIELELSRRDLDVVAILDKDDKDKADKDDPQAKVWKKIEARLKDIEESITVDASDSQNGPRVHQAIAGLRQLQMRVARSMHTLDSLQRVYWQSGGTGELRCRDDGSTSPAALPEGLSDDANGAFATFGVICRELRDAEGEVEQNRDKDKPAWLAVALGSSKRVSELKGGELRLDAVDAANLRELLAEQRKLAARADQHYQQLRQYLECLQQRKSPTLEQQIAAVAKQLADFLKLLATLEEVPAQPENTTAKGNEAPEKCGDVTRPALVTSLNQLAGDSGAVLGRIQELLATVGQFAPARSFFASLQAKAQEIRESELHTILAAIADSTSGAIPDDRRAEIAVRSIKLISLFGELSEEPALSTSAVLIDIADAQLKANNARIEAQRLAELSRLADLRLAAVRSELTALLGGIDAVAIHRAPRLPTLLRAYNEGWVRGRLQRSLLEADMKNQEYLAWVQRQRTAADAVYAMLEPAFNELKVRADGGFTAQEIATYLQTLGIGAIAVGTN